MTRRLVLDLQARRALWAAPDWFVGRVRDTLDEAWEVVRVSAPADSDGDGGSGTPEATRAARGAEVYVGFGLPPHVLAAAGSSLRWAHSAAAGVGGTVRLLERGRIQFTNSAGIHAEPIADWVLGAIVHFTRGFDLIVRAQAEGRWAKDDFTDGRRSFPELPDLRVGIVGLGGIGTAVGRRCVAIGMPVRGVRRHPSLAAPGLLAVGGPDDLVSMAAQSDVLVVAVPQTPDTERMIDARVLGALPQGAVLVNVSRGRCVDEAALLDALDHGPVQAAALDVFASEPLPAGHAFWRHPRVLVSPHVSAVSERFWEREATLLLTNIERYLRGKELLNMVDLEAGY